MRHPHPEPPSPCLHHCGFRDGCCKNCFRTQEEVRAWRTLSPQEKEAVMAKVEQRKLALKP
jgi:predicted Fe-S protein YdhL (DUF1289 family)